MPVNVIKYILALLKAVLRGDAVINPLGTYVASPAIVETKVLAASSGAVAGGILGGLIKLLPLPEWVKRIVLLALPAFGAVTGGYLAPHTERTFPPMATKTSVR